MATVYPATLAILNNVFTDAKERAMAIGIWSGVSGIAVALGPLSGGLLLEHFAWDSVFYVSAPVAVIALIAGRFLVPESRDPNAGRFDLLGAVLSIAGIALLTWSLIEAPSHGWDSPGIVAGLVGAVAILAVFAWWQARRTDPILDVTLFRNPRFAAPSLAISLAFFGLFGFSFLITQYFQVVRGYDPLRGGVATLPFAFFIAVFAPLAIILMRRFGTKIVVVAGLVLMMGGFLIASITPENANYWQQIIAAMSLMSGGLALTSSPATDAIMGALPLEKAGVGSAVNDTTREIGGVLGVAVLGSVLNSVYSGRVLSALTSLGAPHSVAVKAGGSIVAGLATAAHFPAASRQAATSGVQDAFMTGLHWGSLVAAASTAAAALVALVFLPARVAPATTAAVPQPADHSADHSAAPS
jgi:MFS family permease